MKMQNKFLDEYIKVIKAYKAVDGDDESLLKLFELMDKLEATEDIEAKKVLVNVYRELMFMNKAYELCLQTTDMNDFTQRKKLESLRIEAESWKDDFAFSRPLPKDVKEKVLKTLPCFKYHPYPIQTKAFSVGEARICPCCEQETEVYYSIRPYAVENIDNLCPDCIASGKAAKKWDATFIEDAEWEGEVDKEKEYELFCCTPGFESWQGEHWLSCCNDYCAFIDHVGIAQLEQMGIAEEVVKEYEERGEYTNISEYLTKEGDYCGYLFRCLHCQKYHLYVDSN